MKKIMNFFVLVAAAAMALVSCQKNEIEGPVKQEVHFTINAGISTKTIITDNGNGTYTPSWTGDEQLGVLFSAPNADTKAGDVVSFDNKSEAGETASFQGSTTVTENGTFYSFYPASAFNRGYGEGDARLDLNPEQKPSATSFDPSCDILVTRPYEYEVVDGQVVVEELYFKRLMSVLRIDLNSDFEDVKGEFVESVSFTAGDVKIVGYARVFLDNPDFTTQNWASSGPEYCTVTARYDTDVVSVAGTDNSVYLVIAPVTISAGKELTFEIKTKNYNISKTVTVPAEMKFAAGNVNKINLSIKEENCAAKDNSDYSGTYIVVAKKSDIYYYMSTLRDGELSGNNRTAISSGVSEITDYTSSKTDFAGVEETCVWNVAKVDGGYTFANMDNTNYLYTTDANRAMMGTVGQASTFTISVENNIYTITDNVYYRTLSLNTSSDLFACYESGQNPELTLIPYVADTTPRIIVADEDLTQNVAADATELTFDYDVKNITGTPTVTVASEPVPTMTVTSATAADGTVTVTFEENEETSSKSATITLSYEGATPVNVVINQAAKAAEGGKEESVIYSTEFNYPIKGSAYNSSTEIVGEDEAGTSWGIVYGNWNSSNCAQLRVYSAGNFGSIYMKFDVANATRVSYKANVSDTDLTLNTYYSIDSGSTWTKVNESKSLTADLTAYEFTISETGEYSKVRIKFEAGGTNPSTGNYKLTIDDVVIYGFKSSGGEIPDPTPDPEPELQERNLTFSPAEATATVGEDFTEPTLSGAKDGVVYLSSNTAVATVDAETGEVTPVTAGTTTITATAEEDATYKAGEASYTLTVSAGGTSSDETWTLVIDTGDLVILNSSESSTYNKYKGVQTATAQSNLGNTMDVEFYIENVMPSSNRLQFKANAGLLYTTTSLGAITNVEVDVNSGTAPAVTIGSSENPTTAVNGGAYVSVKKSSSSVAYYNNITITFQLN